jgi:hypothetical protein
MNPRRRRSSRIRRRRRMLHAEIDALLACLDRKQPIVVPACAELEIIDLASDAPLEQTETGYESRLVDLFESVFAHRPDEER